MIFFASASVEPVAPLLPARRLGLGLGLVLGLGLMVGLLELRHLLSEGELLRVTCGQS